MPTYKFNPNPDIGPYFTHMGGKTIQMGQEFELNGYISKAVMEADHIEFVKHEPYITPIICSYYGADQISLDVPDCSELVDILVYIEKDDKVKIWFNDEPTPTKFIVVMSNGPIMRSICTTNIKTINCQSINNKVYSISLVPSNQYNSREVTQFSGDDYI